MKKLFLFLFIFFLFSPPPVGGLIRAAEGQKKALYFFSENCPHCQRVDKFFLENNIYNDYEIKSIDASNYYNLDYLNSFFDSFLVSKEKRGWPVVIFEDKMLLGDQPIIDKFQAEIEKVAAVEFSDPQKIKALNQTALILEETKVDTFSLGFLLSTAFLDSLNPCSLAVAVFLLALFIFFRNGKKPHLLGFLFTLAVFSSYFLLGLWNFGIKNPFKISWFFSVLMGFLAVFCGLLSLVGFLSQEKKIVSFLPFLAGLKMAWESPRIDLFRRIGHWIIFISLGFASSFLLFPCADRPYIELVSILSQKNTLGFFLEQLFFYNLIFIFPLLVLSALLFFLVRSGKTEIFLKKNFVLIDFVIGIVLIFIGIYFIHNRI
jgi:cytochrome c biogenesis protein CcdA